MNDQGGAIHFDITGDERDLVRALAASRSAILRSGQTAEEEGARIENAFKRVGATIAGAFTVTAAMNFAKQVANVRGEFQQLEVAFKTMLGSAEKADALMSQLVRTAAITPFDLQGVANGAKQLLAYGLEADKVNETLIRLGDIAAGLSIPLGDIVYLYGTTMTQGRLFTQDLRQFMGRGIPLADELAKQFGVAKDKVGELVTAGKVGFPEVQKAIEAMTNEGGKFAGLMEAQSKTISGQISNLEDAIASMFNEIGKQSEGIISGAISGASYLVEHYEEVGRAIAELVAVYGAYKAALITITALQKLNSAVLKQAVVEKQLAAAAGVTLSNAEAVAAARTKLLTAAQQGLVKSLKAVTGAMMNNPYVLAAAAVAGLAYGIYKLVTAKSAEERAMEKVNEAIDEYNQKLDEQKSKAEQLHSVMQDDVSTIYSKQKAYEELIRLYPELLQRYSEEEIKLLSLIDLTKELNSINDKRKENNLQEQYNEALKKVQKLDQAIADAAEHGAGQAIFGLKRAYETASAELDEYRKKLDEFKNTQKAAEWNNAPAEVKIATLQGNIDELKAQNAEIDRLIEAARKKKEETPYAFIPYNESEEYYQALKQSNVSKIASKQDEISYIRGNTEIQSFSEQVEAARENVANLKKELAKLRRGEGAEADYAKAIEDKTKELADAQETLNTLTGYDPKAGSEYTRLVRELASETEQARIDAMQEGLEKELAQIDHDYAQREAKIREQEEKLRKAQGGMLTETQQGQFADMRATNDKQRGNARFHALAAPVDTSGDDLIAQFAAEEAAMNEYLKEYGTFRERIQAIKDMYDKRISEAKTEGERMAAEAELAEILAAYELEMSGFVDGLIGKTSEQLETMLAEARSQLDAAKEKFDKLDSSSTSEAKQYKETINRLAAQIKALESQLGKAKETAGDKDWTKAADLFQAIGSGARDAAESIRGLDEGLADVLTTIANLTSGVGGLVAAIGAIKGALTAAEKASAILAAISAAVSVVSGLFSIFGGGETSMERNIRLFRELNDELVRLKREAAINSWEDTIFGADRYRNAAENMKAYTDAMARYQEKLEEIRTRGTEVSGFGGTKGFVKSLDKEKANLNLYAKTWESAEESIANMKVQTRHSTWFRSAKYASLGSLLPALFNDDGSLNMEALKEFQGNDLYKKLTEDNRKMIDDLIADWDLYQEALDEVKSYLSDIFGELGDTMTDALVDAFKNGTDAAQAFTDSVSKMLEDLAKDMIYSVTLAPLIDKAQEDMLAAMGDDSLTDEEKFKKYTSILSQLTRDALSEQDEFNRLLSEYNEAAKRNGFDLFSPDGSERTATAKGIAQASQDSVDELNGRFTAIQGHTFAINENVERLAELQQIHLPLLQNLSYLATIDENTSYCRRLEAVEANTLAMRQTLENIELRGITVKA